MEVTPVCVSVSVYMHLSEFVNYMILPLSVVTVVQFCSTSLRLQTTWTTNIEVAQLVLFVSSDATHFVPTDCQTWTKCEGTFLYDVPWRANQRCCGQLSPASPSGSSNLYMKMDRERRWNGTDRRQPKYWEENLSQCYCVHHQCHADGDWNRTFAVREWSSCLQYRRDKFISYSLVNTLSSF